MGRLLAALLAVLWAGAAAPAQRADWRLVYGSQLIGEVEPCG